MGGIGELYHRQYEHGNCGVVSLIQAEEANLLHARRLARQHGWWNPVTGTMQALRALYDQTGRHREWRQVVEEVVPDLVEPATDGPLPSP
jgi:hypothetical protein